MSLIIATSRVGEGRSVGEVVVVLGRTTQMLLHGAANMSMCSGGVCSVAVAADVGGKTRSRGEPVGPVRRRRVLGRAHAFTW